MREGGRVGVGVGEGGKGVEVERRLGWGGGRAEGGRKCGVM